MSHLSPIATDNNFDTVRSTLFAQCNLLPLSRVCKRWQYYGGSFCFLPPSTKQAQWIERDPWSAFVADILAHSYRPPLQPCFSNMYGPTLLITLDELAMDIFLPKPGQQKALRLVPRSTLVRGDIGQNRNLDVLSKRGQIT